jgi:flagellar biosynthesis component FlhA
MADSENAGKTLGLNTDAISESVPLLLTKFSRKKNSFRFKLPADISSTLSTQLSGRTRNLHVVCFVLMFFAVVAIVGGLVIIYYAGELAMQQRSADVDILLQNDERLRAQREQIQSDADENIQKAQSEIPNLQLNKTNAEQNVEKAKRELEKANQQNKAPDDIKLAEHNLVSWKTALDNVKQQLAKTINGSNR